MGETRITPPSMRLKETFTLSVRNPLSNIKDVTAIQFALQGGKGERKLRWYLTPTYRAQYNGIDSRYHDNFARLMMDPACAKRLTAFLYEMTLDTTSIDIGPLPSKEQHPEYVEFDGVWKGRISRKCVSGAVGINAWYPTYSDLGDKFKVSAGAAKAYSAISECGGTSTPADLNDFTWLAAWIHDMTPQLALNFIARWKREFSHWLITEVSLDDDEVVHVGWNPAVFDGRFNPAVLEGHDADVPFAQVIKDYLETDAETYNEDFNGTTFQKDISGTAIDKLCVQNEEFTFNKPGDPEGTPTGEIGEDQVTELNLTPEDVGVLPTSSGTAGDTSVTYTLVKDVPTQFKELPCQHLEDNTNCLAIANDLGVCSQTSYDSFAKKGAPCYIQTNGKGYKLEKVSTGLKSSMDAKLADCKIAAFQKKGLSTVAISRNKALLSFIKQVFFSDPANIPPHAFEKDGEKWYVIKSGLAGLIWPSYGESRLEKMSPDNEPLASTEAGLSFFKNIFGSSCADVFPLCISASELAGKSAKAYNMANDVVINMQHYNVTVLDATGKLEYDHCVEKYKQMCREGGNGVTVEDEFSMWWLLLLIIPVLAVVIILATRNKKEDVKGGEAKSPLVVVVPSASSNGVEQRQQQNKPQQEVITL